MNVGIYNIVNSVNGKYYVGSSSNIKKRWREHIRLLNNNKHHNDHLQHAWNKYGKDSFNFVIVEHAGVTTIKSIEQKYLDIAKHEQDKSYNLNYDANGGEISDYSKEKIRQNKINYWKSDEKRKNLSEKLKNKIASDPEYKNAISDRTRLFFSKPENRIKLSESKKKFHSLPETKKKWSELNSGLNNPQSDKTKYYFVNKNSGNKEFCTRYELRTNSKYIKEKLSQSGVSQLCTGKFPSYKGWIINNSQ